MKGIQDFAQYSIFKLLQLLWDYYDHVRYCSLWGYEVYYFYYIRCCTEICFQKGDNDLNYGKNYGKACYRKCTKKPPKKR